MKNSTRYRIIEISELLSESILPIVFWVSVIFGFDVPYVAGLTIISAVIHELGHFGAIYVLSGKGNAPRGHSSGFRIKRSESLPYYKEMLILLCGPLANILLFVVFLPFGKALNGYCKLFGLISLATGLSNLLPFEGYDGYGILSELFKSRGKEEYIAVLNKLSFAMSAIATFIALHFIDKLGEGYWIFCLFFLKTVSKLGDFGKYDIFEE